MSEQQPNNPEYLQHHPDAVQDARKAEAMAYAAKESMDVSLQLKQTAKLIGEYMMTGEMPDSIADRKLKAGEYVDEQAVRDALASVERVTIDGQPRGSLDKDLAIYVSGANSHEQRAVTHAEAKGEEFDKVKDVLSSLE